MVCYDCSLSLANPKEVSIKFGVLLCENHLVMIEKIFKKTLSKFNINLKIIPKKLIGIPIHSSVLNGFCNMNALNLNFTL